MKTRVLTLSDRTRWSEMLPRMDAKFLEIYFTPEFYDCFETHEKARAECFVAESGDAAFMYPFFRRGINPDFTGGSKLSDIFTAYGYGGVLSTPVAPDELRREFDRLFRGYCKDTSTVAEFIRFLPGLEEFPHENVKRTVVRRDVNVTLSGKTLEQLLADVQSKKRNQIRKGLKNADVQADASLQTLPQFLELYKKTMDRVQAGEFYYFSDSYFERLAKSLGKYSVIVNAARDGRIMAASYGFCYNNRYVNFLAGSDPGAMGLCPNDAVYWGMLRFAKERGCDFIRLGGGLTMDQDDPLFAYKAQFSRVADIRTVSIGKRTHSPENYEKITAAWEQKHPGPAKKYSNLFLKHHMEG